jgi:hypothetical protein
VSFTHCGFCGEPFTTHGTACGTYAHGLNKPVIEDNGHGEDTQQVAMLKTLLAEARGECERLREALQTIADPVRHFAAEAEARGDRLDGARAARLADDPSWLRGMAQTALSSARRAVASEGTAKGDWWCCKADYPNHEPGCPNIEPRAVASEGTASEQPVSVEYSDDVCFINWGGETDHGDEVSMGVVLRYSPDGKEVRGVTLYGLKRLKPQPSAPAERGGDR